MRNILTRLGDFQGLSRFTTWAHKITIRVALAELRRARWNDTPLEDEPVSGSPDSALEGVEDHMMLTWVKKIMAEELTPPLERWSMPDRRAKELPVTPLKDLLQPGFGPPAAMPDLRSILEMTDEEELDCDQTCELLDQYVEGLERREDVGARFPGVDRHLKRGCPDCDAELKALRAAIEAADSIP